MSVVALPVRPSHTARPLLRLRSDTVPVPDFERALDEAKKSGSRHVVLLADSSLDVDELSQAISAAHSLGFTRIHAHAAMVLSAPALTTWAKAGLTHLVVPLFGAHPSVHDYHAGVPGAFEQTRDALLDQTAWGLPRSVTTPLTRSNYRVLEPLIALLQGVRASHWNIALPFSSAEHTATFDRLMPRLSLAVPFALKAMDHAHRNRLPASIQGAPSCLLGPFAQSALESRARAYATCCDTCSSRPRCPGVDAPYLARFKGDELIPRSLPAAEEKRIPSQEIFDPSLRWELCG